MLRVGIDRTQAIVDQAVREAGQALTPGPSPSGRGENGTAGGMAGTSIQDEDGNLYFMCGVSVCGGPDVVAP